MKPWTFKRWLAAIFSVTALSLVGYVSTSTHPKLAASASGPSLVVSPVPFYPTFVFQPGGTTAGNTYTTWASLMAAVALTPGVKTIVVDDSLATAHATTGGPWNVELCTIAGKKPSVSRLIVDDGCLLNWSSITIDGCNVRFSSNSTVTTLTGISNLVVTAGALVDSTTATAPIRVTVTGLLGTIDRLSTIGDGVHPVITFDAGSFSEPIFGLASRLRAHAFAGLGSVFADVDAAGVLDLPQDVSVFTPTLRSKAAVLSYTPGTAGNWQPAPTVVNAALDQLAAPNFVQAAGNTGTGGATVTVTTGNITKARSGIMVVEAAIAGEATSAGATVTAQIKRDSTNIGTTTAIVPLSVNDDFAIPIMFADTAPDTSAHTYQLSVTAGAGNITCASNSAKILVHEL